MFVFGLTIFADIFASESHPSICLSQIQQLEQSVDLSDSSLLSDCVNQTAGDTQFPCGDPCHYGASHFGHSSYLVSDTYMRFQTTDQRANLFDNEINEIEDPFIKGLRRPPRHA